MKNINEIVNNTLVILGNDLNSFLTSYSLKKRYPQKEIYHLIIKDNKSVNLQDNVFLLDDWIKTFNFDIDIKQVKEMTVKNFYDKNEEEYSNDLKSINFNYNSFLNLIKNKCIELGVKVDEGYLKDIFQIKNSIDSAYINVFNDFSYNYIQFDNLKETKNIHAGFYIDCMGEKSFFFNDDFFDRTKHTANTIEYDFKFNHYSNLLPNDMMISGYYDEKSEIKSTCEARPEGVLYRSWDGEKCYVRYYFEEKHNTKHIATDTLKKEFNLKDIKQHNKINCIREKNAYLNVFAIGNTIGNLENVICNDSIITQKLLINFVELFKHIHISTYMKNKWSEYVKHIYDEHANFTSLHYALTTRSDTFYWLRRLNQNYKIKFEKLKSFNLKKMMKYFKR